MAKKTQKTILVTGATGKQGGAVFQHLRKSDFEVRVLTRDPNKPAALALVGHGVAVVQGDLEDPASLARALDEVDGVFSVQDWAGGLETEVRQGNNLIDAASRAGISHFVYNSVASADQQTGIPHFDSKFQIEEHLRGKGMPYTIFRPPFFMENWLQSKPQIDGGTFALPLSPETLLAMIAVDDIGSFVAQAFERPGIWLGKTLEIAGDERSIAGITEDFAHRLGKPVEYKQIPLEQFKEMAGEETAIMFNWFQKTGYQIDLPALREQFHHLTTFERWLNTNWQTDAA